MRKKELVSLLEERQQRVDILMRRVESAEDLIKSYQAREQSVVDAMATARTTADRLIEDAHREAEAMLNSARTEAETIAQKARRDAETMIASAKSEAEKNVAGARSEREGILKKNELAMAEYQETISAYNRLIEESAAEAIRNTNRYVALLKNKKLPADELNIELDGAAPEQAAASENLPNTEGNPALLMRNIYQIQNREIPDLPKVEPVKEPPEPVVLGEDDVATRIELPFFPKAEDEEEIPVYTSSENGHAAPPAPGEVPRVNQFVERSSGGALSLDDLLDEIIKAGDK